MVWQHGVVATRRTCGAKALKGAGVCRTQSEEGWSCGRIELVGTCLSEPSWAWPILYRISKIFRSSALWELLETLAEAVKALLKLLKTQKMENIMAFSSSKHLLIV